jgi:allantoate deiminase
MPSDSARDVIAWCRRLADCTEQPGVTTRTFLSEPMRSVHAQLREWMERTGMTVRIDSAGNLRGVRPGASEHAPRLYIGSHLDTVPNAGAFDGILGVVLGIALVERARTRPLQYAIEVIGFSEEEGIRFGIPFIGSRAFTGTLTADTLERRDARGASVADAVRAYGLSPEQIDDARAAHQAIGFLEFHTEQGPVLDRTGVPLGVVTAVAGQSRYAVVFTGAANHAGTTPMNARRDAVAAAAEWIAAVERLGCATPGLVATVGRIEAHPNAANVIAGGCTASLDVRHADDAVRRSAAMQLIDSARTIGARRGIEVTDHTNLDQAAVPMDPGLTAMLERSVMSAGYQVHRITSGAGHDAMVVADRMPAAMLFVRSPGGVSHHPNESVIEDDVEAALAVGLRFLDEIAVTAGG